jgi:hypothetical protein
MLAHANAMYPRWRPTGGELTITHPPNWPIYFRLAANNCLFAWIAATAPGQTQDRLCVGDPARRQNSNFNPNWISRPGALVPLIVPKADDWTLLFG